MQRGIRRSVILVLYSFSTVGLCGAGLVDPSKFFTVPEVRDEREEQLAHLKEEQSSLQASTQEKLKELQDKIDQVNKQLSQTKNETKEAPAKKQDFLTKKTSILNEIYQVLFNVQFMLKERLSVIEQHIKALEEYQKDPDFKTLILEPRSYYPYEMVQGIIKKVFEQEDKIKVLTTQKNDTQVELENLKKKLSAATKNYQEKKKQQEEFATKATEQKTTSEFNLKERGELLDLEEKLTEYQQELAELKVQAATLKIALMNTNIFIESKKLDVLKNNLDRAKAGLRISEAEVQEARAALEKEKQQSLGSKEKLYEEINRFSAQRDKLRQELEQLSKRYQMPILEQDEFATWTVETPTPEAYMALCEMGLKNAHIQLLDQKIKQLRAQIQLEDVKFKHHEMSVTILSAWHNIAQRKDIEGEEVLQELKKFQELEAELQRELNSLQDVKNNTHNTFNFQNKELANLRNLIKEIQQEKEGIFQRFPLRYNSCLLRLTDAEKLILERIEIISKLLEIYNQGIADITNTIKEVNIITAELKTRSIWQRSQYAISWQGIKSFIPDLWLFAVDIQQIGLTYISGITWGSLVNKIIKLLQNPGRLFLIIFIIIGIVALFFILRRWLPHVRAYLLGVSTENKFFDATNRFLGCITLFIERYFVLLYGWLLLGAIFHYELVTDLFPRVLFYLVSIPYLIYLARRLIRTFVQCNKEYDYSIFAELFERRFILVLSIFFYMTIFVLFFREAFVLSTIHKSELPNILLAAYSIVLRTLIIFSIGKEEILTLLSGRGPFWTWVCVVIDHYYYPILIFIITIMILSDPYVGGYGNLVSYILWGLVGTAVLARILYLLHTHIKRYSEVVFFSAEEETKRERFVYAKTWYGIFVIVLFLLFIIAGIAIGTKIWNVPVAFEDVWKTLDFKLFSTGIEKGEPIWFTPRKFLVVISFIISGVLLAIAFNRFVLQRIFDILPVDLGIQNTVLSLTRYLLIFIAIYLGFQWAGLNNLLLAIAIAIGSLSFMLREPISDFVSYFIILVQRPIQIGDYIMISDEVQGVVRKITPRSIILRRKDSYSIILPNSTLLTHPVNNWSYARNFVAFDDIYLTVSYKADPFLVKKIIQRVLEESTDVLKSPRPIIRLHDFGEYGFVFMIRGFVSNINILRRWDIASEIRFSIIRALQENNIHMAVPTRLLLHDDYTQEQKVKSEE